MWGCVFAIPLLMITVGSQEVAVDGIVAVVNQEVITLTDFRIVHEFGINRSDREDRSGLSSRDVLEGLIEQKLIILITNADINVPVIELERLYQQLSDSLGTALFQRKMVEFDLKREELSVYLGEMIASRRVLEQRFQMAVTVSLREIEAYYNETYVPEQTAGGLEPEPMVEILDQLETAVKSEGTRVLIGEWVRNLRKEADIQVFAENYPQYFDKIKRKGP